MPTTARTAMATPTPIPADAPLERPWDAGAVLAEADVVLVVEEVDVVEALEVDVVELDDDVVLVTGSWVLVYDLIGY